MHLKSKAIAVEAKRLLEVTDEQVDLEQVLRRRRVVSGRPGTRTGCPFWSRKAAPNRSYVLVGERPLSTGGRGQWGNAPSRK